MSRMTFEKWEATYRPVRHSRVHEAFGGRLFDGFYGEKKLPKHQHLLDNEKHVWSFTVDPVSARCHIAAGFVRVNRGGIFLCEVPFDDPVAAPEIALGRM